MDEIIELLKKYTDGKHNTEKVEINVIQLNRIIKALEQEPCDKYIKEIDHLRKYIAKLETKIVEQQPCDDAISRQAAIDAVTKYCTQYDLRDLLADVEMLYSITPSEKVGRWIMHENHRECSHCNVWLQKDMPRNSYCPNCGAKMVESEVQDAEI